MVRAVTSSQSGWPEHYSRSAVLALSFFVRCADSPLTCRTEARPYCGTRERPLCPKLERPRIRRAGSQPRGEARTELGKHRKDMIAVREAIMLSILRTLSSFCLEFRPERLGQGSHLQVATEPRFVPTSVCRARPVADSYRGLSSQPHLDNLFSFT